MTSRYRAVSQSALVAGLAVVIAMPGVCVAGPKATEAGRASATVVEPIRAAPLQDLSFGSVTLRTAEGGSVEIYPDGSAPQYRDGSGPACPPESQCAARRGSFEFRGEPNRTYRLELPDLLEVRGIVTGATLLVGGITTRSDSGSGQPGTGQLDTAGRDILFVGGRLELPAGTAADRFRANLPITVSYD